MPPGGGGKRKRGDRSYSGDDALRNSPHRPAELDLARQGNSQSNFQPRTDASRSGRQSNTGGDRTSFEPNGLSTGSEITTTAPPVQPPSKTVPMTNGQDDDSQEASHQSTTFDRIFDFEHITDVLVQSWADDGRDHVKSRLISLCQIEDVETLNAFTQELVESATTGRIDTKDAGLIVKDAIAATQPVDSSEVNLLQESLLSAVAVLFADEESDSRNSPIPHVTELGLFLHATEIGLDVLRLEFDSKLIEQLGLVRDSFYRQMVRKQTNLLYRQSNYNLLREESEGFSKLVTELFTTSGNEVPHNDVVEATVEKIKAMIGAFDLDVGRSLDVVLDVFGSVLVKQYRFFVKFLRASPWWPRTDYDSEKGAVLLRLGGLPQWALPGSEEWQLTERQKTEFVRLSALRDREFWNLARETGLKAFFQLGNNQATTTSNDTSEPPRAGSYEAAQLLGFKLRFYSPGAEGDSPDGTPKNLIYLAALLIKIGFISLHDLYPHLWRPDAEMNAYRDHKQADKDAQETALLPGASSQNALMMAGALSDDTAPLPIKVKDQGTRSNTPLRDLGVEKSAPKESALDKPDQKVSLLLSLLGIGALPEALFILGKFSWMTELIPEISDHINRILHHTLSRVYENSRPLRGRSSLAAQLPVLEVATTGPQKGRTILEEASPRRLLRWPLLDRDDSDTDGISYRFYWDEWSDNVPVCVDVDDVFVLFQTLLPLVGPRIGQDPSLLLKIVRIGKTSLSDDDSHDNRDRWLDAIKRILLPALSLSKPNPCLANEIFELLNMYPIHTRYLVYAHWFAPLSKRSNTERKKAPKALLRAEKEASDVLKRISKTNLKPMARALAKIAYSNPHVVVEYALRQIESYDAISDCFVEGARYFTDLGYDVLSWALIRAMSSVQRTSKRTQDDGIFVVKWLVALSRFAGKIYKRYHLMKPGPILQFISQQIDKGETADLTTLEQMVVSMAGITPDTSFNDAQLLAMGGGPLLQSQTVLQLLDQRHTSKATAKRLVRALQEYGLTTKLLLSSARLRQFCVFDKDELPLKAVGNTFDEVTRVLNLYFDLLKTNLSADELHDVIPDIAVMINDYDIPVEIAFWISRPVLQKQLADYDKDALKDIDAKDVNNDVDMLDQAASEEDGEAMDEEEGAVTVTTPAADEAAENVDDIDSDMDDGQELWHPVLKQVMTDIQSQLPPDVTNLVGLGFYVTFWQLSTYEISIPGKSYEEEMNRQKKKIASITSDRTNVSVTGSKARDSQLKQLKQLVDDLLSENKQHIKACSESRVRLQKEKDKWFAGKTRQSHELNTALMEHCFLPRILLSTQDAYYCFKLVKMLHAFGTPNFRTIGFYDLLFRTERLTSFIFQCTSKESDNLGKFLYEVLKDFDKWRQTRSIFEKEAYGSKRQLLGFAKKVEKGKPHVLFDFDDFRKVLFKWHSNLHAALLKCLGSTEYMHVRNAISILRAITPVWPSVDYHGRQLKTAVDKLRESEREDLKVPSQAMSGALHRRQREWISPSTFRPGPEGPPDQSTNTTSARVKKDPQIAVKQEETIERAKTPDVKVGEKPPQVNGEKLEPQVSKPAEPSVNHSLEMDRKPSSRAGTPIPARPLPESNSRRPVRSDSRAHELPRRVSPPPRTQPPAALQGRSEADSRVAFRDHRPPRSSVATEPATSENRPNHLRPPSDRNHEQIPDASHRYPRPPDRLTNIERDERPARREMDQRSVCDERRYNERDGRPERNARPERDGRSERDVRHERDHGRPLDRDYPRPSERDYGHPPPEHSDRRREETHSQSRRDVTGPSGRNLTPQAQSVPINPERAALIQGNDESRPGMSIRGQATERARTSRPASPKREEERKQGQRNEREDRPERRTEPPSRTITNTQSLPTNTRTGPAQAPPRDTRAPQARPAVDMLHGRLEQDNSHRPPIRPDRNTEPEPPSGPRSRGPNVPARTTEVPSPNRAPPPSRPPPSGPGRHSRNNSFQEPALSIAPPSTDVGAVHPDRMMHISPTEPSRPPRPPPIQASPPSGPRSSLPTGPSAPSPNTRGPPSGPQAEGGGRGRRHPMATVNNTLAQAAQGGQPPPAGRGRGGPRQNSAQYPAQMPPPSPVGGQNTNFAPQQDLMANNNPNGVPVQPRGPPNRQDSGRTDDDRRPTRNQSSQNLRDGTRGGDRNGQQTQDDNRRDSRGPPPRNDDGRPQSMNSNHNNRSRGGGYRGGNSNSAHNSNSNMDESQAPSRKHPRDESSQNQYGGGGGMGRGGSRVANDTKRPRRGG